MKCEYKKSKEYNPVQFKEIGVGEVFLWFYNGEPYGQPLLKLSSCEYINLTDKVKSTISSNQAEEPINKGLVVEGKFTYSY